MFKKSFKVVLMNEIVNHIGTKIKQFRKQKGLTQAELAEKINVDPKYISRLETGTSSPSIATIAKLGEVLNVDVFNFFVVESKEKKAHVIELINSRLVKATVKELNAIFEIVSVITEQKG